MTTRSRLFRSRFFVPGVAMLLLADRAPAWAQAGAPDIRPEGAYLDQGWDRPTIERWYHVDQGTVFMPAEWFAALEQASGEALFIAPDHMARLGFLPDTADPVNNRLGLPVGFSVRDLKTFADVVDPVTRQTPPQPQRFPAQPYQYWPGQWVGLTCAACHTGELTFRGQRIRLMGGPAHLDLDALNRELGLALGATMADEAKFGRFVARVNQLGVAVTPTGLSNAVKTFLEAQTRLKAASALGAADLNPALPTATGFGRLDALATGGNLLLADPLGEPRNYQPTTAPVRYPMLWDTPYFDWVLYNACISGGMVRNVVEDLGVGAPIDPATYLTGQVRHGAQMENIGKIHADLTRLESPAWPAAILGAIDQTKAAQGAAIFQQECASCHQVIDRKTHQVPAASGGAPPGLTIPTVPLATIGTDPLQAQNSAQRVVTFQHAGGPTAMGFMDAIGTISQRIVDQWAHASPANAQIVQTINAGHPSQFRASLAYRARPLNGLWATPPYLHNGSVPSMWDLLNPAAKRPRVFFVGSAEYDPVHVGLAAGSPYAGAFAFDTRLPGNSNAGHEYGTDLDDPGRWALIEYLKTL
jgi:mono/diheme cytochrome c family protein